MAEKPSELIKNSTTTDDILSEIDRNEISTVTSASGDEVFVERYSGDYPATDREAREMAMNTSDDAPEETEHLKAQIEETRKEMGETIDAIQERLSFQNISEQVKEQVSEQINYALETAKDTVYDATIKKAGKFMQSMNKTVNEGLDGISKSGALQTARANPLALSLIGLGVGLLLMNGYRSGSSKSSRRYAYGEGRNYGKGAYDSSGESHGKSSALKSAQEKITNTASHAYDSVSHAATGAYDSVSNAAGNAYDKVSSAASGAASGVSNAASSAYGSVTNAASTAYGNVTNAANTAYNRAGELSTQAREQYDYYIEENPLAVGAVALAVGAAVGLAIPSTRYEGQLMGDTKQNLLDLAHDRAGELVERVKQVASEAQKTIGEEVRAQNLTH